MLVAAFLYFDEKELVELRIKYLNDLLGKGVEGLEGFEIPLFLEQYSVPNVEEINRLETKIKQLTDEQL